MNCVKLLSILLAVMLLTGCAGEVPPETGSTTVSLPPETTAEPTVPPQTTAQVTVPPETTAPTLPETAPTEPGMEDIVRIADYIPDIAAELPYASAENFTGQRIYDFDDPYLRYGTVLKLRKVQQELAELGLGLKIWDGFRPVSAQQRLWDICPDPKYVSNPVTGSRSHCRGSAVDITLVDLATGEELEMPTGFDDFTPLADRDYSDCTETAAQNAKLLEEMMTRQGFKPYSAEWWHFSDTTDYPVDETFEPRTVSS